MISKILARNKGKHTYSKISQLEKVNFKINSSNEENKEKKREKIVASNLTKQNKYKTATEWDRQIIEQ